MSTVKIYSTSSCPWCVRAKAFFKELNIPFEEIDVAANQQGAQDMVKKSGQRGVPVIEIDNQIIVGFNQGAIKKALHLP